MNKENLKAVSVLFTIILLTPLITSLLDVNFYLTQLTMSIYYAIVSIGLCMLMGYAGQISMGQAAFFSIGGYTTAVLTTINLIEYKGSFLINLLMKLRVLVLDKNVYDNDVLFFSPWVTFFFAIVFALIISFVIGIPVLKLKGHYLAMATMGFGIIIYKIVKGTKILGQADGISAVPLFKILPFLSIDGDISNRIENFYFAGFILLLGLIILINLINSRVGRALRSLHGSEEASNSMGINTSKYKLYVFMLGAVFASIGGFFLTHYNGGIGPSEAGVMKSVRYVAIVAVGGMANIWGTLIFGILLNFLSLRGVFGSLDDAVFGAILILVMIFAPDGLIKKRFLDALIVKCKIIIKKIQLKLNKEGN
ncbi:MAG: branched-chain amino acid ABC transporter permease [Spirochaetes bacterium]|nr:branched-chain amino acid ABC transporter permease [Spirochaetota bacterium]